MSLKSQLTKLHKQAVKKKAVADKALDKIKDQCRQQQIDLIVKRGISNFMNESTALAKKGEPGMEIIRIPTNYLFEFTTFRHEQSHNYSYSLKEVRQEAHDYLYNYFVREGFKVVSEDLTTIDDELGHEYWKVIKINWDESDIKHLRGSKKD